MLKDKLKTGPKQERKMHVRESSVLTEELEKG